ncbi:MAG TPA: glycosyltransferase family 4 protein [Ornithinibacter sp.]|nr:glycosyltransferase family 4 protein [Ornithinibacter sp.]
MTVVHVVVPDGVHDPARPSGGNTYDRRLCTGLAALGWDVHEDAVRPENRCGQAVFTASALAEVLAGLPTGSTVLLDGLVASDQPEALGPEADRLRLVVLVHLPLGLGGPDGGSAEVRAREAAALRCVAAVVTTSRWTRHWLLDAYGLEPARVVVALPGVEAAPEVVGDPAGRRLLCVGAVVPAKGHDVLLEALARVADPRWHCTWVGSLDRDPGFVERLRARAVELGVADRVRCTGPLGGPELGAAYAGADLLVTASRGETYGMAVTEALAHGIPVLATRVGGLPEAVGRAPGGRRPGILVPPDDPGALAGAVEQWLGDPGLRAHLRAATRARRASLPTWSGTSAEVDRVLAAVAA